MRDVRKTLTGLVTPALIALTALVCGAPSVAADAAPHADGPQTKASNPVVAISPNDTPAQIRAKAATVTPSPRQLAWQQQEMTAFIHFGVNMYTEREHGTGTEDPNLFQPDKLDTDQWVTALKNAGFKSVILTVKHHDGFLLFPSRYTDHSVESTTWREGKGDVVRELAESAREQGLALGLYVSPADLHEAQPGGVFANGSTPRARTVPSDPADVVGGKTFSVTADDYNTLFMNNLYEMLTRYGDIAEVWWDGANPTGRDQPYNYTDWTRMVRTLQPGAIIFQDIDIRWVGNEDAVGRQTEWSPTPLVGDPATAADRFIEPEDERAEDMASDAVLGQRKADGTSKWNMLRWTPAECDASIMVDGWFWPWKVMKTAAQLENQYYTSVGRNCQLLLNVGPDTSGLLDRASLDALATLSRTVKNTFATDLTTGSSAANDSGTGNTAGHPPAGAVDEDPKTSWQPTAETGGLVLGLGGRKTFDVISVQEDITIGMRTQGFAVDRWTGSGWDEVAKDTTVGYKKLVRLKDAVITDRVRLRITGSRDASAISSFGLFKRPPGSAVPGVTAPLRSGLQGICLDNTGGTGTNENPMQIKNCDGSVAQLFTVNSDDTVQIAGKCLDVYGGGIANRTPVQLYTCHGGPNQTWQHRADNTLFNPQSGRCLDIPGAGTTNGTKVILWDCHGGAHQQWRPF